MPSLLTSFWNPALVITFPLERCRSDRKSVTPAKDRCCRVKGLRLAWHCNLVEQPWNTESLAPRALRPIESNGAARARVRCPILLPPFHNVSATGAARRFGGKRLRVHTTLSSICPLSMIFLSRWLHIAKQIRSASIYAGPGMNVKIFGYAASGWAVGI
ncbi:hypothetical protein DFH09DRAFT_1098424 [Mycena vulgaris]|nr:hypothetical protein DFH09DRAFT_1098424 [Mycena vulgaris]